MIDHHTIWSWVLPIGVSSEQSSIDWRAFREIRNDKEKLAALARRLRELGH